MQENRTITPDDLGNLKFLYEPNISPDGTQILFTVSEVKNDNEYAGTIWKASGDLCNPIINFGYRASSPIWSPDGSQFLFLLSCADSQNRPTSEIWISDPSGLERRKLLSITNRRLLDPKWSPDSGYIYLLSDYDPLLKPEKCDVRVITRREYRTDGKGYQHDRRTHVFRVNVREGHKLGQITSGKFDVIAFDLSPDGKTVAFVTNMDKDADLVNQLDIHTVPVAGGEMKRIFRNKGPISSLSFSPNGKYIAYVGHDYRNGWFNTPLQVWLLDLSTNQSVNISAKLDRATCNSVHSDACMDKWFLPPCWTSSSEEVLFLATDKGRCNIYSVEISNGRVKELTQGNNIVTSFSLSLNGKVALSKNDPATAPELYTTSLYDPVEKQLTNSNQAFLSKLILSAPRGFFFNARDGTKINGFFTPPITPSKDSRPPPCIVVIHSGGATEGFRFMHEFQCFIARGYAVITCNFRGTPGYGEDYVKVLTGHYMEKDYSDIIDMVNYAIDEKWIDRDRIGICGGSYGGYLTNWAIGHDGKLFAAAVTERSVVNLYSLYGTADKVFLFLQEDIQMAFPWDRTQHYMDLSPISYTKNITTPLLIIHSEQDYHIPFEQAQQLYGFLKRQGKEVVLVEFPGEGHGLWRGGKPHHRIERLKFYLWWFTTHIDTGIGVEQPPIPIPEWE